MKQKQPTALWGLIVHAKRRTFERSSFLFPFQTCLKNNLLQEVCVDHGCKTKEDAVRYFSDKVIYPFNELEILEKCRRLSKNTRITCLAL